MHRTRAVTRRGCTPTRTSVHAVLEVRMSRSVAIVAVTATLLAGCALPATLTHIASSGDEPLAAVHRFSVLHYFTGPPDGSWPNVGRLVFDNAGNLYGATNIGGSG